MRVALQEAKAAAQKGEVPVGAVVMRGDEIVAQAHNRIIQNNDPTAHAELLVIRLATQALNTRWLSDCALYVTLEPCAMCAGAMVLARLENLVFGAFDSKTGACGSLRNIVADPRLNHRMDVTSGVLEAECGQLLKGFFSGLRQKKATQQKA
jgi:tRNA(adenine34) deaminase